MKPARLLARILAGNVAKVSFSDLTGLLAALGFTEIGGKGSHRIFARPGVTELVTFTKRADRLGEVRWPIEVEVSRWLGEGPQFGVDGAEALVGPAVFDVPFLPVASAISKVLEVVPAAGDLGFGPLDVAGEAFDVVER